MLSFQGMRMRTEYMMERIRQDAIAETVAKFQDAARRYYTQGCDSGETVKLIKDLEELGVSQDVVFELEWQIREECGSV